MSLRIHFNYKHEYLSRAIILLDCNHHIQMKKNCADIGIKLWTARKKWENEKEKVPNRCAFLQIHECQCQSKSTYSVDSHQCHCHYSKVRVGWQKIIIRKKTNKNIVKGGIGNRKIANSMRCKTWNSLIRLEIGKNWMWCESHGKQEKKMKEKKQKEYQRKKFIYMRQAIHHRGDHLMMYYFDVLCSTRLWKLTDSLFICKSP